MINIIFKILLEQVFLLAWRPRCLSLLVPSLFLLKLKLLFNISSHRINQFFFLFDKGETLQYYKYENSIFSFLLKSG